MENCGKRFTGKSLLIVEDDDLNCVFLEEIFFNSGLIVHHVMDGKLAIDYCTKHAVDLILMDIRLPEVSGYEATDVIKKMHPGICIIAQTAYAFPEDRMKALRAGCDAYISKPFKAEEIFALVVEHLDK